MTEIKRVLHVEAGRHLYGGALQVVYLMRGLAQRGIENVLVCPQGAAIAQASAGFARICEMKMAGDWDVGMASRLARVMREVQPDVAHLHSRRGADVWGGVAARHARIPAILSRRVDNPEAPWWARRKYRLYDRVITISQGIRDVLLAEGVEPARVTCVPSSVDTEKYRPGGDCAWLRGEFALPADAPLVAMIAQFISRKGHRYLLDAIPRILNDVPRARFLLFGKGPLEAELRASVEKQSWGSNVIFGGFRNDLDRILPCVDVIAHPADMEGLGVSLLQAAACGVPVVASRAGGIPEAVRDGENGILVAPGDVGALAQALTALLRDDSRARAMGEAGRALVEREFSVAAMIEGNLRTYREVLASHRAQQR